MAEPAAARVGVVDPARFGDLCSDLGALLAQAVESGAGVDFVLPFSAADGAAWWRAQEPDLASGRRVVLVARVDGELVGTASLLPAVAPNQSHRADVSKLLVAPPWQGRGVATLLMGGLMDVARARGRTLLTLDCVAGCPAEALYRTLGFTVVGRIPGYAVSPDGVPEAATFLYRDLTMAAGPPWSG